MPYHTGSRAWHIEPWPRATSGSTIWAACLLPGATCNFACGDIGADFPACGSSERSLVSASDAQVVHLTKAPRGTLFVGGPLGVDDRVSVPKALNFHEEYLGNDVRLRLTDRTTEGLDQELLVDQPEDNALRITRLPTAGVSYAPPRLMLIAGACR